MALIAEFVLRSASLPLVNLVESLQTKKIEYVHGRRIRPGREMFIAQIDTDNDVSQADIKAFDEVVEASIFGSASGKTVYKLIIDLDESVSEFFDPDHDGVPVELPTVTREGWHETKMFKTNANFIEFRKYCQGHGVSVKLNSITSDPSPDDGSSPYGLTNRQYEALTLALSRGYYEQPREATIKELAEELCISQPSMSGLLRRSERQLLSSALGSQEPSTML